MAMIEVEKLTKKYRDRVAIDALSFTIDEGSIVGFLGPNGAGKSTTMKILTGFMPATEGKAKVAGFDIFEKPLEAKRKIGYLPETPPLYPELTVRGYLKFVAELKGVPGKQLKAEIDRVSQATGITSELDRLTSALSKGYRQRVGIAQALLGDPALLILDEPTEGLDPRQRKEVLELIKSFAGKHTVVLSTHILAEVKAICQRVLIIHRGKIVANDSMEALTKGKETGLEDTFIQLTAE
ncbi:MAG: ABC transporter ATP-binding protein [Myxococcota bacterium]